MRRFLLPGLLVSAIALFTLFALGFQANAQQMPVATVNCDCNGDGNRDLSDAVYELIWLFAGGPAPVPLEVNGRPSMIPNGDCNGSGMIDLSDAVYLLQWLFVGGDPPVEEAADSDGDGRLDGEDNCPLMANEDQADTDGDGVGDACDACPGSDDRVDTDADTVPDGCDNCPQTATVDQTDTDADGVGNACDNCVDVANGDQQDSDGDGLGDACDQPATFVGALAPTNGRWNYGGVVGLDGANAACEQSWPGSTVCLLQQLQAAAAAGELVGAVDLNGIPVDSFWSVLLNPVPEIPATPPPDLEQQLNVQCWDKVFTNGLWDYLTAHTGVGGQIVTLSPDTGTLSDPMRIFCGATHWVACCNP